MRYLFVLPRFTVNFGDYYTFPLGIAYVSAAMKQAGFQVEVLNLNHSPRPIPALLAERLDQGIDVVCTGGLSGHYTMVKQILQAAREHKPEVLTIVGGGLLSSEPAVVMEGTKADFGVIGEGEETMCELAAALETGRSPGQIAGLIFRTEEGLKETARRKEIPNLDALPWPDYEGFELGTYLTQVFPPGTKRIMSIATSRSCPYECTFCYHPTGRRYRQRSLDAFFEEFDHLVRTYHLDHVNIQDELFSMNRDRASAFCRRIKEYQVSWDIQVRVDLVTADLLQELKDAGCSYLSLGIESVDDTILKSMRKHITRAQIERALQLAWEADVEIQGNLIFGDLEETTETARNTLEWWKANRKYHLDIFFIMVYPGTHLYREACRRGLIQDRLKYLEEGCPLINVSRMSAPEFKALSDTLVEFRNSYPYVPSQLRVLAPDARACCTVEVTCRKCGESSRHPNRWIFASNLITCPRCHQRHDVEPYTCLQGNYEAALEQLLAQGGNLAIWGAGNIATALLKASPTLRASGLCLVDSNVSKQGFPIFGHPVVPPTALQTEGIDTVLIASILYQDQIAQMIQKDHPSVKRLLTLSFHEAEQGVSELRIADYARRQDHTLNH
ncbi:MAG TPA: radical SAM protein [Holophaga sp.]|nr:radical SAM protein [Holophaga sp.]